MRVTDTPTARPMPAVQSTFFASLIRVVDGDTQIVQLDRHLGDSSLRVLRLLEINCPEIRGPEKPAGEKARDFASSFLDASKDIGLVVEGAVPDKYGRLLAYVWRRSDGACLNDALVDSGNAAYVSYSQHMQELADPIAAEIIV